MTRRGPDCRHVAIDGPPGAGVSALARAVASATGCELLTDPAADNPFLDSFAKHPARYAFQAQTYCLLARYRQQVEIAQPDLFAPRGVLTDYSFARDSLFAAVVLSPEELRLYTRIHETLDQRLAQPDLLVYVTADRDTLRNRIRRLVSSADRVVKLQVIDQLADEMDRFFFSYDSGPVLVINTSNLDFVERPEHLEELTELIRNTRAGVHHVRPVQSKLL